MSATIADLKALVSVDGVDKGKSDLKSLGDSADKAKGKLSDMGGATKLLKDGFAAGLGAVTGFVGGLFTISAAGDALGFVKDQLVDIMRAGLDEQKIQAQTAAVIASTGGAAHLSAAEISDYADKLALMSGISNDTIQSSENLLLTFRAVGKDVFPQATKTILDMSVAMHEDLQSATIQVGKALQDPIHGVTTLQRVGVQLTQAQKDLIKQFVDTGQSAKAQGVILDELNKEFGGSAEAAGKTLPGQLARLNESWDQAKEKIGLAVIPILQQLLEKYLMPVADWLGKFLPQAIDTLTGFLDNQLTPALNGILNSPFVQTIQGWATAIANKLSPQMGDAGLAGHTNTAKTAIKNLDNQAKTTTDNMAGPYVAKIQTAIDKVDKMTDSLGGTTPNGKGLNPAIIRVNANLDTMDAKLNANAAATKAAQQPTEFLGGIFDSLGLHIKGAGEAIGGFVSGIAQRLGPAMPAIKTALNQIQNDFSLFGTGVHNIMDGLGAFLSAPFRMGFDLLEGVVNVALDALGGKFDQAGIDIQNTLHNLWNDIQDWGAGLGRILLGIGQAVLGWLAAPFIQSWQMIKPSLDFLGLQIQAAFVNMGPAIQAAVAGILTMVQNYINNHVPHIPGITMPSITFPGQSRASGGPVSGDFLGAERGPELLVSPGVYHAPPGSYVYNAPQTAAMLNGGNGGRGMGGGDMYFASGAIVIQGSNKSAGQLFDEIHQEADRRRRIHG